MQQILILRIASLVFYLLALIVLVLEWYYKVETSRYLPYVNEHYEWFPLAIAAVALVTLWFPIKFTTILFILIVLLETNVNFKSNVEKFLFFLKFII